MILLDVRLGNGPRVARQARALVATLAASLPARVVEDLTLLVSEAVTNSHRHAGISADDVIVLRASRAHGIVRVEVTDPGVQTTAPAPREPTVEGGWGLQIVRQVASRWGTVAGDGGTTVWFELPVEGEPAAVIAGSHPFAVSSERSGTELIVRCKGELDMETAPGVGRLVRERLAEEPPELVRLDWSALTFMDSSGIRLLFDIVIACKQRGIDLLWDLSAAARRGLDAVGIHDGLLRSLAAGGGGASS